MADRCISAGNRIEKDHGRILKGNRAGLINAELVSDLKSQNKGIVVAGFHLGPYQYIPVELGHLGYDILCVVRNYMLEKENRTFEANRYAYKKTSDIRFRTLAAENPRTLLLGIKEIQKGASMLFFMDGNTGIIPSKGVRKHDAEFTFMGIPVKMRTGVPYVAQKAGVPIIPAVSYYNARDEICVEFLGPVSPPDASKSIESCTIEIYRIFENYLKKYPEQWEAWFYLFRFWSDVKRPPTVAREDFIRFQNRLNHLFDTAGSRVSLKANRLMVGLVGKGNDRYIFDGHALRILKGNPLAFEILSSSFEMISLAQLVKKIRAPKNDLVKEIAKLYFSRLLEVEMEQPG